jgi:hypothetical protein
MSGRLWEPRGQPGYLSYLLRLWQVDSVRAGHGLDSRAWRGSLESSLTGERLGFASLDELFEYLLFQTGAVTDVDENYR